MGRKIRTTISIDEDIWILLGMKLSGSKSQFFEDKAREYIFTNEDLNELRDEIVEMELELRSKKKYLNERVEIQKANDSNLSLISKAMITIRKIVSNQNGFIGRNQIGDVAKINGLSPSILEKEVKRDGDIHITNAYKPPKI